MSLATHPSIWSSAATNFDTITNLAATTLIANLFMNDLID